MATMDVIKLHGGSPANFLDIGGGASAKEVMDGFHILDGDKNVRNSIITLYTSCYLLVYIGQGYFRQCIWRDHSL